MSIKTNKTTTKRQNDYKDTQKDKGNQKEITKLPKKTHNNHRDTKLP